MAMLVVRTPFDWKVSLAVNGTPCSGPQDSPRARAPSAARARARAPGATVTTALIAGLYRSIRSRWASTTASALSSPARIRRAKARALSNTM